MMKSELIERKWRKFLFKVKLFKFVPFVDFVVAAGSLVVGGMNENSDFDVIVGVKSGRIFTVRFFSALTFGILGWRRSKIDHGVDTKDKICLSHFVTQASYKLAPPYNEYWKTMYSNLVPIMGDREKIDEFFKANDWLSSPRTYSEGEMAKNELHIKYNKSFKSNFWKFILSGSIGDWLEKRLKAAQVKRIEAGAKDIEPNKRRLIYTDELLEFHTYDKPVIR